MQGKERTFTPEVEKVWNKDYQCEYYRGVIIDGEDNIVERCTRTHASYDAALDEAEKKMAYSPLYYRQAGADIKEKLPWHKDIWKITSIVNVTQNKNQDSKVTVRYLKFGNLTKEFKKREKKKTIVIKRKWAFYNDLMEYIHNYADIR
jgi:hypothetical protein